MARTNQPNRQGIRDPLIEAAGCSIRYTSPAARRPPGFGYQKHRYHRHRLEAPEREAYLQESVVPTGSPFSTGWACIRGRRAPGSSGNVQIPVAPVHFSTVTGTAMQVVLRPI